MAVSPNTSARSKRPSPKHREFNLRKTERKLYMEGPEGLRKLMRKYGDYLAIAKIVNARPRTVRRRCRRLGLIRWPKVKRRTSPS